MRKLASLVLAGALASLAVAACGSSSSGGSTSTAASPSTTSTAPAGGGATLKVAADPSKLAYTTTSLSTKGGPTKIDFNNPSQIAHNVTIQDPSGKTLGATDTIANSTATTSVDLKPGTYTFFCSVDGHEAAGMKGTLTVK